MDIDRDGRGACGRPRPRVLPAMNLVARTVALLPVALLASSVALAQTPGAVAQPPVPSPPKWSFNLVATGNFYPNQDDNVQPTLKADRGALHLEGRYNYEDLKSVSGFVGWNYKTGSRLTLALTPMFGAVVGNTDGPVPALEFTLGFGPLELYTESEYVINVDESSDSFYYHWSELSVSATRGLSLGVAIQRSRVVHSSRDLQRGPFAAFTAGRFEGDAYLLNPGSDDHYFIAAIGLSS